MFNSSSYKLLALRETNANKVNTNIYFLVFLLPTVEAMLFSSAVGEWKFETVINQILEKKKKIQSVEKSSSVACFWSHCFNNNKMRKQPHVHCCVLSQFTIKKNTIIHYNLKKHHRRVQHIHKYQLLAC